MPKGKKAKLQKWEDDLKEEIIRVTLPFLYVRPIEYQYIHIALMQIQRQVEKVKPQSLKKVYQSIVYNKRTLHVTYYDYLSNTFKEIETFDSEILYAIMTVFSKVYVATKQYLNRYYPNQDWTFCETWQAYKNFEKTVFDLFY